MRVEKNIITGNLVFFRSSSDKMKGCGDCPIEGQHDHLGIIYDVNAYMGDAGAPPSLNFKVLWDDGDINHFNHPEDPLKFLKQETFNPDSVDIEPLVVILLV